MPAPILPPDLDKVRHTPLEDIQGLSLGVFICAVGITFLAHLGFLTGWSFGIVFFLVNLPFYWLAWRRMGTEFTLKSLGCVAALSTLVDRMPTWVHLGEVNPVVGTAIFGALTGLGLLAVFRHRGSLGGLGVVALMAQDRLGFKAGYVQLIVDAILFAVAFFLFPGRVVAYSLFGAVILNGVIAFNHRRDRYIAP
ncbi:YitT family protein [Tropicimonas sp. IMCC34043]|uniref:YitT family protein n=1 Tax=Tropicimonas sp. IMCC34043 TaxID=2248760 RepID=UPI000E26A9BD|nr:YitT family protein [Tropicimonas sp. IMCC34043]